MPSGTKFWRNPTERLFARNLRGLLAFGLRVRAIKSRGIHLERVTGIEPALSAWEAEVLPLNYTRTAGGLR